MEQRRAKGSGSSVGIRQLRIKLGVFAALCALPLAGALQLLREEGFIWALAAYLLVSILSFLLYWSDKHNAQNNRGRTPETTLHASEMLGGWPGALVAQQVFRHKTRKPSYQVTFWLIVLVHQLFWFDLVVLDGRYLSLLPGLPLS